MLGPSRVLTTNPDFEMIEYINGINQEGLANPDDSVSKKVTYWVQIFTISNSIFQATYSLCVSNNLSQFLNSFIYFYSGKKLVEL